MNYLRDLWMRLTLCKEVEQSGKCEKAFLEYVYRVCYAIGLSKSNQNFAYKIYSSVILLALLVLYCSELMYPILVDLSLVEMISSLNMVVLHSMSIWKHIAMMSAAKSYENVAKSMESPYFDISTEGRKKLMEFWVDKHSSYNRMLHKLRTYNVTVWNILPLFDGYEYNLPIDLYIPFAYDSIIGYTFMYLLVVIVFTYASYWVIVTEAIIQAHLYPLICQYAVLADCFENIFEDCATSPEFEGIDNEKLIKDKVFQDKYLKKLGFMIKQYKHILDKSLSMQTALSTPMLGQLAATGMLLCMAAYQATAALADNKGKFFASLLYLGYNMFTFYHVCKSCEEITIQSQRIGEAAYFSGWESGMSLVPGVRSAILIVIARSNKPLIFLAGGMYPLSLISYANLVKTSYSALTMMLRMSKN